MGSIDSGAGAPICRAPIESSVRLSYARRTLGKTVRIPVPTTSLISGIGLGSPRYISPS
jgi:hypothetical protein